jgi:phage repressor protein C with HTH and peptisase S24 domain
MNASPQTINNWEARGISKAGLLDAEKIIGCSAVWLQTGNGSMVIGEYREEISMDNNPDYPAVRRVKLALSAGISGFSVEMEEESHAPLVFGKYWYQSRGYNPSSLLAVRVKGDSMEPRISDTDTVVINTSDKTPVDGKVFAVNYEGEAVIKRMVRDAGQWWLSSDNPDQIRYARKLCAGDSCIIIGLVVHHQTEKI